MDSNCNYIHTECKNCVFWKETDKIKNFYERCTLDFPTGAREGLLEAKNPLQLLNLLLQTIQAHQFGGDIHCKFYVCRSEKIDRPIQSSYFETCYVWAAGRMYVTNCVSKHSNPVAISVTNAPTIKL